MTTQQKANLDNKTTMTMQQIINNPAFTSILEQALHQVTQQIITNKDNESILFTKFAETWFSFKAPVLSRGTQEKNIILYAHNIKPYFKDRTLLQIDVPFLQQFMNERSQTHKPSTMKIIKSIIKQILDYAEAQDLISKNPIKFISIPKGEEYHKRALTPDEIKRLLKTTKTDRLWIVPYLLLCTGLRRSELLALTWDDIDFNNKEIIVTKGYVKTPKGDNNELHGTKTKSSKRREAIDNNLIKLLRRYKFRYGGRRKYVVGQLRKDAMIAPRVFDRTLRNWGKKAGIDNFSSHCFRHTYASMAYEGGQPTLTIARQLGHSSTRMCEEVYIHKTTNEDQKQCAKVIGQQIFGESEVS